MKAKIRILAATVALALALGGCGGGGGGAPDENRIPFADTEPNEIVVPDDLSMIPDSTGAQTLGDLDSVDQPSCRFGSSGEPLPVFVIDGSVNAVTDEWDWFELVLARNMPVVAVRLLVNRGSYYSEADPADPLDPGLYVYVDGEEWPVFGLTGDLCPEAIDASARGLAYFPAGTTILLGVRGGLANYRLTVSEFLCPCP